MSEDNDDTGTLPEPSNQVAEPLRRAIGERYLQYALSTIMHRALPDARDGLKPVHRRILYAMRELRLSSTGGFRKSAKISGDVMGNYHPHGDAAIYDAMARLAQDFTIRYPLVDGQGNFGNIDGDNPAASRYTEARLTAAAEALMEGLNEDAVDFRDNYDGTLREPEVLPAAFPNLLANGSSGIAVGMATNIPPHNIGELVDACLHLIKAPNARDETLVDLIPGPDFPTGGVIVEPRDSILQAYATGRGAFRLRARFEVEDMGRGQWQIVVTEIPYQVQKSKLIEKLAELIQTKKVPILADVRDESADDVRIILEPRSKNVDPEVLMGTLFRLSDLETRFSLNMNVLIDGRTPKVCSLKEVLRAFLDHRQDVLLRRSRHRLGKIDHRLEVLEGFIVAFLNLDRVIDIIRYDEDPKSALMAEDWSKDHVRATSETDYVPPARTGDDEFGLSDVQAEAILNMRLRSLRRLEEMELLAEQEALMRERADLEDLLAEESLQWARISDELREVRKAFGKGAPGGARRSSIEEAAEVAEVSLEDMIEREPITVVCSKMGWIRAMKGHIALDGELKFKDGDEGKFIFHAETTDKLLVFGSNGRFYTLSCASLPGGRGMGEPIRLMVDLPNESEITDLFLHDPKRKLLVASSAGDGFCVAEAEVIAQTRSGKQVLNVKPGVSAIAARQVDGDSVAVVGENRKLLVFPLEELPEMTRGKGVRLQKYKDGGLSDLRCFALDEGLSWLDPAERTRTVGADELVEWRGKRAGSGRMAPRGFRATTNSTEDHGEQVGMSTVIRWIAGLAVAAMVAGCGANKTLGTQKDLGEFRLGHNVVIADNAETIALSREVDLDEMEKVMTAEIDRRLGRYEGRQLYHVGVTVAGYFIAPPGVPVVASPKSVMILLVNIWDDAAQKKLTDEPHQITVFESAGVGTLAGSGYLQNSDEQVLDLAQNAVAEIETFIAENPEWFKAKPGLEEELRDIVVEESGGAEAAAGAADAVVVPQAPVQPSPAQSDEKPKPRPLPM